MVDLAESTTAFKDLNATSTAVSEVIWDKQSFMLFGHKNHKILNEVSVPMKDFDPTKAFKALDEIDALYINKRTKELNDLKEQSTEALLKDPSLKDGLVETFKQKVQEILGEKQEIPENHRNTRIVLGHVKNMMDGFFKGNALKARNDTFMKEQFGE